MSLLGSGSIVMGLHFPGSMGSPSFEIGVISPMPKASGSVDVLNDSCII